MPEFSQKYNAPTRFKDPGQCDNPAMQSLWKLLSKQPPDIEPALLQRVADALTEGDPLADAVAQTFMTMPSGQGRAEFEQALTQGIETVAQPSEALVALFQQVDAIPLWLDREMLADGARVNQRVGWAAEFSLSCMSLMGGYQAAAAVKPLVATGNLVDRAPRRMSETGSWWLDVTRPNAMCRFNDGFKAALRVRMMHALVRVNLSKSDAWQGEDWGLPINQADSVSTNCLFNFTYMLGLRLLGFRFTKRESDAQAHLWRYVGFLMGIPADLQPASELESAKISYVMGVTSYGSDQDGIDLANALTGVPMSRAKTSKEKFWAGIDTDFRTGFSRLVLGEKVANDLRLEKTWWRYVPWMMLPLNSVLEIVRQITPGATAWAVRRGDLHQRKKLSKDLSGQKATFVPTTNRAVINEAR